MADYNESLKYLEYASTRGSKLGLERITELLERLGNPQNKVKIIQVAGTNGKGSFTAMTTSILTSAGYKTGGFTSPAITDITDCYRINCEEISHQLFAEIMTEVIPEAERMVDKPTEFEVLTAVAYQLFYRTNCDVAVVECGMGGDTDSTNAVANPLLSVITNISRDHVEFLGETITEIAEHKAGIIKTGRPVVLGNCPIEAYDVIFRKANEKHSEFYMTDIMLKFYIKSLDLRGTEFSYGDFKDIKIHLLGSYQKYNAATVLTAVEALRDAGLNISDTEVRDGMSRTKWHGRFELLSTDPYIIFDGAHNPDGIHRASESINYYFDSKAVFLIGVMSDKEYNLYADILRDYISCVFAVSPDNKRTLDSEILADSFSLKGIPAFSFKQFQNGLMSAYVFAKDKKLPLIALGSLYMYRQFIAELKKIQTYM